MATKQEITRMDNFKKELFANHYKTMVNFLRNEENANKFMSSVIYSIQKTPKLLECDKTSLMNAFMTCAEFGMYPSSANGECYVLPYGNKAQFQLGYQGIITLLYRSGIQSIRSEIIRETDEVEYINGILKHKIDIFKSNEQRGQAIGAYVIIKLNGQEIYKVMNKDDIMKIKEFSKSKNSENTPWTESNDPELWMWRKTVLKQASKLLPKNEKLNRVIEEDNKDSVISDEKILDITPDEIVEKKLEGFESEEGEVKEIS